MIMDQQPKGEGVQCVNCDQKSTVLSHQKWSGNPAPIDPPHPPPPPTYILSDSIKTTPTTTATKQDHQTQPWSRLSHTHTHTPCLIPPALTVNPCLLATRPSGHTHTRTRTDGQNEPQLATAREQSAGLSCASRLELRGRCLARGFVRPYLLNTQECGRRRAEAHRCFSRAKLRTTTAVHERKYLQNEPKEVPPGADTRQGARQLSGRRFHRRSAREINAQRRTGSWRYCCKY